MLTISQVADKYRISNRQVHDLIDYGYLSVAQVSRNPNRGITYLFSENEIQNLDIHSLLEEIRQNKNQAPRKWQRRSDFKRVIKVVNYYDNFLQQISDLPEKELLKVAFYLFHLNHYAKTYQEESAELYRLKNRVLKKMYQENSSLITARYLVGPDRNKIWLCEDCKDSARSAGLPYTTYVRKELYCPKCYIQSIEKEYYSLLEFRLDTGDYRFTFHLPRNSAARWLHNIEELPQGTRKMGQYLDKMYLYGRFISRIEEKVFPIGMIKKELNNYLGTAKMQD